jgi:hypothetical protein
VDADCVFGSASVSGSAIINDTTPSECDMPTDYKIEYTLDYSDTNSDFAFSTEVIFSPSNGRLEIGVDPSVSSLVEDAIDVTADSENQRKTLGDENTLPDSGSVEIVVYGTVFSDGSTETVVFFDFSNGYSDSITLTAGPISDAVAAGDNGSCTLRLTDGEGEATVNAARITYL